MKTYYSLADALTYTRVCPICGDHISSDFLSSTTYTISKNNLSASFDLYTDEVSISYTITGNTKPMYVIGEYKPAFYGVGYNQGTIDYTISSEYLVTDTTIVCRSCHCYEYKLDIFINMRSPCKFSKASVVSEYVAIDDKNLTHEIENYYRGEPCTIYKVIEKDKNHKSIKLPLVFDNLSNPKDSLNRIKNLIVFS